MVLDEKALKELKKSNYRKKTIDEVVKTVRSIIDELTKSNQRTFHKQIWDARSKIALLTSQIRFGGGFPVIESTKDLWKKRYLKTLTIVKIPETIKGRLEEAVTQLTQARQEAGVASEGVFYKRLWKAKECLSSAVAVLSPKIVRVAYDNNKSEKK
ncbi:MAG: hypothetical protein KAR35_01960 [Candidatus Heimdallarchaeota archaeon]|nr:hypothetical protein [Candidatus Heimdallarchaeota archaeon]MCK5048118.1 hypothetical protein [Candidatus Heimdallarchaeota archaeon]